MQQIHVDQKSIAHTELTAEDSASLAEGEARLRLQCCALTANNITYALAGFDLKYWSFFPTQAAGKGLVPVWGVAEVVESRSEVLEVGARLYGFYPLAEELVMTPQALGEKGVVDRAAHRAALPGLYNHYGRVTGDDPHRDHLRALFQPLLATSYVLADWLQDNGFFDAEQVIIGSASSKTGLGLCKFLSESTPRPKTIVGLTSAANKGFVESLGTCDQVLTYDAVDTLAHVPSVYVDMAGNAQVKAALHARLADVLKHSAAVGISHWDQFNPGAALEGPKPEFFFAPAQIAKRQKDWGPGVIERKIAESWTGMAASASEWLEVKVHHGLAAAPAVWDAIVAGKSDPREGHIIVFDAD
ncbi:DUF2855 family protein [Sulfitobacter sp. JB4-11]|uniref:DUF2855 family protein n=1 Tax=Sulfitobacter rhodophyticola TaxID=3238304 RepID=UPI003513A506